MKKLISSLVAVGALAISAQANATVFDFQDLVDNGNEDGGVFSGTLGDGTNPADFITDVAANGEAGFSTFSWTKGATTLTVDGGADYAYLDKGKAGLGVCKVLTTSDQCDPGNDDNVTLGEVLNFGFSSGHDVDLNASTFRKANHGLLADLSDIEVNIDGGGWLDLTANLNFYATNFSLRTTDDSSQFYIDALSVSVAEPATVALMGLGLAGLGVVRRRKA